MSGETASGYRPPSSAAHGGENADVLRLLQELEERYELVLAGAGGAIWDWDVPNKRVHYSTRWKQLRGFAAHEIGESETEWSSRIHPDDVSRVMAGVQAHFEGRTPFFSEEYRTQHKDGHWIWILDSGLARRDASGNVVRMAGSEIDISERKRAEQSLRANEKEQRDLSNRLKLLLGATSQLIETLELKRLLPSVLDLSRGIVSADAYAVWRVDAEGVWSAISASGLSEDFLEESVPAPEGAALPREPLVVQPEELANRSTPLLSNRWARYDREGIRSLLILPLYIHGETAGTLVFYRRSPDRFSEIEIESARALGNIAAAAITTAELYKAESAQRSRAEESARREAFMSATGEILAESLEYEKTLANVARAAVPNFADWCAVDLLDESGQLRRLAVAHVDPRKVALAVELHEKYPPDRNRDMGVIRVLRTGEPEMLKSISQEFIEHTARDEQHLQILRQLNLTSYICVPLRTGEAVCGAITFVSAESVRHFEQKDFAVAQEIARRASQAIEKARLYRDLSASRERQRIAAETAGLGIFEWIQEGDRVVWENERMYEIFERTHEEGPISGKEFRKNFLHPEDIKTFDEAVAEGRKPGTFFRSACRIRRRSTGEWRWIEFAGDFTSGPDGKAKSLVSVVADITERKRAEQALRESEERYRRLVGLLPVAVYTCDAATGVITFFNEKAAELWGRRPKVGDTDERFCGSFRLRRPDGAGLPNDQTPMAFALREGKSFRNEEVIIERPDGSFITVLVNIDPIRDEQGRVIGAINAFHDITAQKQTEQALRLSEERYRAIVESQTEMVCRFRPDGTILFVNGAYARARGSMPDALVHENFWQFVEENDRPAVRDMLARIRRESPELRVENRFETTEGIRWTLWTNRGISFDAEGRATEIQSSGIDITERKNAEQALSESERRISTLLANLPGAAYRCPIGAPWPLTFVNNGVEILTGRPASDFTEGRVAWMDIMEPADVEAVSHEVETAIRERRTYSISYRIRHASGECRWMLDQGQPVFDQNGNAVAFEGFISDITEQKRAESAALEAERQLRLVTDHAPALIAHINTDGSYKFVNKAYAERFGLTPDDIIGKHPIEILGEEAFTAIRPYMDQAFAGHAVEFETELQYKNGDKQVMRCAYMPERDAGGRVVGYVAAIINITDRKEAEEALREFSNSLEVKVAERTAALRSLAAELGAAEQRERKRLAALLHDDLQQSLVAAKMRLTEMQDAIGDNNLAGEIDIVSEMLEKAIGTSRNLTRQLRPPALYESGLVAALHWLAAEIHRMHKLPIEIDAPDQQTQLIDDVSALLFDCVRELLFNAAKHAQAQRVRVTVREESDSIVVTVEDNGRGFDPDLMIKKTDARGSGGYGLFSIRERLAALGGSMQLRSSEGAGTTICLNAPLLVPGSCELPAGSRLGGRETSDSETFSADGGNNDRPCRVVIADDHAIVRQGIADILNRDPRISVVAQASDGVDAIDAIERFQPELVLLDINMPRMNGIEAAREIHRRWPEIVIVGISVQDDAATDRAMLEAGAFAFIPKSGEPDKLVETVISLSSVAHSQAS